MRAKSLHGMVETVDGTVILHLKWNNAQLAEVTGELAKIGQAIAAEWGRGVYATQPMPAPAEAITDERHIVMGHTAPGWTARITVNAGIDHKIGIEECREVLEKAALNFTY